VKVKGRGDSIPVFGGCSLKVGREGTLIEESYLPALGIDKGRESSISTVGE